MWKDSLTRYRGVFVSTAGFALFFIFYLFINSALQNVSLDASKYASYSSILRMRAEILEPGADQDYQRISADLAKFRNGGTVRMADGQEITLEPIAQYFVTDVPDIASVDTNLSNGDYAAALAGITNLEVRAHEELARKNRVLTILQIAVGFFTLLLYAMITMQLISRLSKTDDVGAVSQDETAGIMATVSEGLFLLGRDHEIGVQQSASLKGMFKQERDLEGDFFDFISQYVTQGDLQVAKDYLGLLFGDRVKEKLVESLNPLNNVEITIARRDGSFENRYLDFSFKRVLKGGKLDYLLASVKDVTKQVMLERQLEEVKEEQEAQIDLLKSILHIDNDQLKTFFHSVQKDLDGINQNLESQNVKLGQNEIRGMLNQIVEDVHKVKGDAAALGLHQFEFASHEFETAIKGLSASEKVSGKDLLPLTSHLRGMFKDLEDMRSLVDKFSGSFGASLQQGSQETQASQETPKIQQTAAPVAANDLGEVPPIAASGECALATKVKNIVTTVSKRTNTQTQFDFSGLRNANLPAELESDLSSIAIQLARNAVVHGGQSPEQRVQAGKAEFLKLQLRLREADSGYELIMRDDGRGIDEQAVFERAVSLGLVDEDAAQPPSLAACLKFLFHPNFSSASEVGLDAGRGVGLPLVRKILKKYGGKISVKSEKGQFCQFRILLPAA